MLKRYLKIQLQDVWNECNIIYVPNNSFHSYNYYTRRYLDTAETVKLNIKNVHYKVRIKDNNFELRFRYIKNPFEIYEGKSNSCDYPKHRLVEGAWEDLLKNICEENTIC